MLLQLYDSEDKLVCELGDDSATLGSAGVQEGWRINVVDRDPSKHKGEFEDLSRVDKYEMSAEDYAKRDGRQTACKKLVATLSPTIFSFHPPLLYLSLSLLVLFLSSLDSALAFKKRMKLAQFAERNPEAAEEMERKQKEAADAIPVGSRCEVTVAKAAPKRGTVMFVGE